MDSEPKDKHGASASIAWLRFPRVIAVIVVTADLGEAELNHADLRWTNLDAANLRDADLNAAQYTRDTIWPGGFDPAQAGAQLVQLGLSTP